MTKYYIDIEQELAEKLQKVNDEDIVEVLSKLASKEVTQDELAPYSSVSEIITDGSLSEVERRQLKLKAQRRSDISKR